jgi:hypothetical protein
MGATKTSIAALIISVLALILAAWPSISPAKGPAISPDLFPYESTGEINLQNQVLELQCYVKHLAKLDGSGGMFRQDMVMLGVTGPDCTDFIKSTMDIPGKGK